MDNKELVREVLQTDAYLRVNKKIMRHVGIEAAIILADLISKEKYFDDKDRLDDDGFFYNVIENLEQDTCLSEHKQRKAVMILEECNFIETKRKDSPPKRYFKINHFQILKILSFKTEKLSDIISINNNKPLSKDKETVSKKLSKVRVNGFTIELLNTWNSLPNIPYKHKTDKQTKLQSKLQKYIKHLLTGTFGDCVDLDDEFLRKNDIMQEDISHTYSKEEIIKITKRLALYYKNGYWPKNKDRLPKSLPELFYNPGHYNTKYVNGGGTSFFLMAMSHKPRALRKGRTDEDIKKMKRASNKRGQRLMTDEQAEEYINRGMQPVN